MKKYNVKIISAAVVLVTLCSVIAGAARTQVASANETRRQIDSLREERQEIDRRASEVQQRINSLEFERLSVVAQKELLDERIALTETEIENILESIDYTYTLIEEKELELTEALEMEDAQLELYKTRVRSMEESGAISYLEIIFDSTSFSDLLARIDFVSDIMKADVATYESLVAARKVTASAKEALESAMEELESEKAQLEQRSFELDQQLEDANTMIVQLMAMIDTEQALYDEEMAAADRIQREINRKEAELRRLAEAARRAEAARQAEAARRAGTTGQQETEQQPIVAISGTGTFTWPVPGRSKVSSPFGERLHPVHKVVRMHTGIDIPAPQGNNIVAADTGTVITSSRDSGYGNYVVISHGDGTTTLYAHMSRRLVIVGQNVEKGDVIGLIGSTGVSTGPHLHFEISIGGSRVDPLPYFTGWTQGW